MRKIVLCILVVNILFSSCSKPDLKIEKLTIVYSGNIGGKKNPCGCNPTMGGFARKSTVVKGIRSEYENVIVLDSGAMLYATNFLSSPLDYIFRIDARASAQAVDEIGIDAVNISSFDLTNSVDSLLAIDRATSYPWLSSNLIWRDSGESIFKPDTIVSKGNIRIGVFGIMSDNFMGVTLFNDNSPLKVLDPVETAEKVVSKLKKESDLIIALAYLNMDKTQELCGQTIKDKILVLPRLKGSAMQPFSLYQLVRNGIAPKGLIALDADSRLIAAAIYCEIPLMDKLERNPLEAIRTGNLVRVNADKETVEVYDDQR